MHSGDLVLIAADRMRLAGRYRQMADEDPRCSAGLNKLADKRLAEASALIALAEAVEGSASPPPRPRRPGVAGGALAANWN